MSILVANLYVATLFRTLQNRFRIVELGAFLDDRNVTAQSIGDLLEILEATAEFDKIAGHKTNLTKSAVFGTTTAMRKELKSVSIQGQTIPVVTTEKWLGFRSMPCKK